MRSTITLMAVMLWAVTGHTQVDTVIYAPNYTSYYSYRLHDPLYVVYRLFRGGGSCDRSVDRFVTDNLPYSATEADYRGSGYDEGHECDSKDFAFSCVLQEATFRFYNCVPQTPKLNRGIWKHFETVIRKESQTDSLLIICGNVFGTRTIGGNRVAVPDSCWKIVYRIKDHKPLHCLMFPNDNSDRFIAYGTDMLKVWAKELIINN